MLPTLFYYILKMEKLQHLKVGSWQHWLQTFHKNLHFQKYYTTPFWKYTQKEFSQIDSFLSFQEKMEEMQQHNMSWIEVQFLKKAVDILCECRRTLMYTYVFAYYLKKNNESEIFEVKLRHIWQHWTFFEFVPYFQDNQKDLENATETLSEYLERDISATNLVDIKQKVQDKYR